MFTKPFLPACAQGSPGRVFKAKKCSKISLHCPIIKECWRIFYPTIAVQYKLILHSEAHYLPPTDCISVLALSISLSSSSSQSVPIFALSIFVSQFFISSLYLSFHLCILTVYVLALTTSVYQLFLSVCLRSLHDCTVSQFNLSMKLYLYFIFLLMYLNYIYLCSSAFTISVSQLSKSMYSISAFFVFMSQPTNSILILFASCGGLLIYSISQ